MIKDIYVERALLLIYWSGMCCDSGGENVWDGMEVSESKGEVDGEFAIRLS